MRDKKAARGKLFCFRPKSEWSDGIAQLVDLSSRYRSHKVVVLGRVLNRPGWVRIVTVTSTLPATHDQNHYLPIFPTKKFRKGGIQLKLCGTFNGDTILPKLSFVRIDDVQEVPLEILSETFRSDGLGLMLQEKSFQTLLSCSTRQLQERAWQEEELMLSEAGYVQFELVTQEEFWAQEYLGCFLQSL